MSATTRAVPLRQGLLGLIPLVASRKTVLLLTVISGTVAHGATVTTVALGALLAGRAVTHAPPGALVPNIIALGCMVVVAAAARWWQLYISHDLAYALVEALQLGIFDGLERAAPAYILGRRTGELASIATADAELMELFYAHMLGDYVSAFLVPLGALIVLTFIDLPIALTLGVFGILVASVPLWLARRADEQGRAVTTAVGALNADVVDGVQGQRELTIFGAAAGFRARLAAQAQRIAAAQRRFGSRAGLEQAAIDALLAFAVITAALVGVVAVSTGRLVAASLPLVIVLSAAALAPVTDVTQTARRLGELRASAARILTIFHQPAHVADAGRARAPADRSVRFEHVGFGYGQERSPALRDVDFCVAPGEMVAIVGRSGAGKSTCVNLLLRFWDPDSGTVRIGGTDVRDLPLSVLRSLVAIVPQDAHLFHDTVAANIRLGRSDATDAEVQEAARSAQIDSFVRELPQHYETLCGERGARISGGQRQRIAIARALVRQAPILVLDEAVSNLDAENEAAFQKALDQIRHNRTLLVIAHRLSTIRNADRIVVLDEGRVVESGRHDDLLACGGAYAQLIATSGELA